MASTMSRRFSTMEFSAPIYQKDMTNDVRLKLAKVRARSRSFCAPSSPPSASPPVELKTKKSSQLPRSSVTALTTSAKAKLRSPQSNGRNTNNANASSSANAPEPNNKRHQHSNCNNRHTTSGNAPTTNSVPSKPISQRHIQRTKSTKSTRKTCDSNNNYYNDDDDMMIKFFESDSDEDDLFLRNKTKSSDDQRRQRRTTMPPRLNVSTRRLSTSYSPERSPSPVEKHDNADNKHTQSMWAELQELKSRLAKLEVQAPPETTVPVTTIKKPSICSPPITRPSSITSVLLSPHSSLVDSACSISNNEISSQSQKILQDTVLHLEQHLRQDDNPNNADNNSSFMNTLVDLVAETISINQTLAYLTSQQQLTSGHLTTLQKSSERQVNLLADALQLFDIHRQQQPVLDHPASPPLSQSAIDNSIGNISPKPQRPLRTAHSTVSAQPQCQPTQSRAYSSYYDDNSSQNYADDTSSQHSNLLTASFNTKHLQRQQQHRRSIASVATAPVTLPHYTKYLDQEITPTRQFYQQPQQLSSRHVSGILHHNLPPSSSYQQPQRYYSSTVERQPKQPPSSQSAFQPMTSRVNRLLSMYEASLKPTSSLMTNATSLPPLSPPSSQQHYPQEQMPYIDYQTRS